MPPWNSHWPPPILAVSPLAKVNPLLMKILPLVVKLVWVASPRVTPVRMVLPLSTVPSLLITVPPTMVPENEVIDRPPTPVPMSSVLPVLVSVLV